MAGINIGLLIEQIKKEFGASKGDAFLMVLGDETGARKMFKEVLLPRLLKLNEVNEPLYFLLLYLLHAQVQKPFV